MRRRHWLSCWCRRSRSTSTTELNREGAIMVRAEHRSAEDRLAARLARMGGVALSQDDLDALDMGDDDLPGADRVGPIQGRGGKLNMEQLLAGLLGALGH